MNKIRQIQELNKRELEAGVSPSGSWHRDYDSAWIYIGGLPFTLSEGDIVTIFSQFGEPVHINLVRDKETGKSKGFAFLKYEDQRSTDLAVDNLSGAKILDRVISVDHSNYKKKDDEDLGDNTHGISGKDGIESTNQYASNVENGSSDEDEKRPMLKEEIELARIIKEHDPEDPMKDFLVQQKREEVAKALKRNRQHTRKRKSDKSADRDRVRHKHLTSGGHGSSETRHHSKKDPLEMRRGKHSLESSDRADEGSPNRNIRRRMDVRERITRGGHEDGEGRRHRSGSS